MCAECKKKRNTSTYQNIVNQQAEIAVSLNKPIGIFLTGLRWDYEIFNPDMEYHLVINPNDDSRV